MKITNLNVLSTALTSQSPSEAIAAAADQADTAAVLDGQGYTPSSELQQLLQLVRAQPEVRDDRVQAATQRLREGYYLSPASAEQTAAALQAALD